MSNNNKKYFIKVTAVTRSEALAYCGNRGMQLYRYENKDLTNYAWFFGVGKFQNLSFVHLRAAPIDGCGQRGPKQQRPRGSQRSCDMGAAPL